MALVLLVCNVVVCQAVAKFFGQAKVDDVNEVSSIVKTHYEICRLDVAVYVVASMNEFYS